MKAFESLLDDVDPGFICFRADDPARKEGHLKRVEHLVNPPAEVSLLAKIPAMPGADAARKFYEHCDGALLYTARDSMGGVRAPGLGIEIFPIEEWSDRTAQMVESWEEFDDTQIPYGRHDFVAFAHSRGASSYIHWVIKGPTAGAIYWWAWTMPPQKDTPPLAEDFAAFIDLICTQPVRFFNELLLGYWRAEDGLKEWMPSRYVADCRTVRLESRGTDGRSPLTPD